MPEATGRAVMTERLCDKGMTDGQDRPDARDSRRNRAQRLRLIGKIAGSDETLSLVPEMPRPDNCEIIVCRPKCGYGKLRWLHEMAEQLIGKALNHLAHQKPDNE